MSLRVHCAKTNFSSNAPNIFLSVHGKNDSTTQKQPHHRPSKNKEKTKQQLHNHTHPGSIAATTLRQANKKNKSRQPQSPSAANSWPDRVSSGSGASSREKNPPSVADFARREDERKEKKKIPLSPLI